MSLPLLLARGPTVPDTGIAYHVEVDWDGDGVFEGGAEDITADVVALTFTRGRPVADGPPGWGHAAAGTLRVTLHDPSARYAPFNAGSPLAGQLLPGRRVRVRTAAYRWQWDAPVEAWPLWQGELEAINPDARQPGVPPSVTLRAAGPLRRLAEARVADTPQVNQLVGTLVGRLLDAAGWPAGERVIAAGELRIAHWHVNAGSNALVALRELEDSEHGLLREDAPGRIVFEARWQRVNAIASTPVRATLSDAPGAPLSYRAVAQTDAIASVVTQVAVEAEPFIAGAAATVLWTATLSVTDVLMPGETRTWIARYPNDGRTDREYVASWVTPAAGVDYAGVFLSRTAAQDLTQIVCITTFDASDPVQFQTPHAMAIRLRNDGPAPFLLTLLQARGTPVVPGSVIAASAFDATAVARYGRRALPATYRAVWLQTATDVAGLAHLLLARYRQPTATLTVTLDAHRDAGTMIAAVTADVSDRVAVAASGAAALGMSGEWYVEQVAVEIDRGRRHRVTWQLSPAPGVAGMPDWLRFGYGRFGGPEVLG